MERKLPRLQHTSRLATEGLVAGVDIGGTNQSVALARLDGEVVATRRRRLGAGETAQDVVGGVLGLIESALEEQRRPPGRPGTGSLRRIGVGFGGPVDVKNGTVLTSHHVSGWDGFPLRAMLEERLDASTVIDNDANAAALGEALFGAGRGQRNLLYVNVGTGIGAGVVLNGRLYHGQHGMAGEIGHVTVAPDGPLCPCGKRGCLEAVAAGRAIGLRGQAAARAEPGAAGRVLALAGGRRGGDRRDARPGGRVRGRSVGRAHRGRDGGVPGAGPGERGQRARSGDDHRGRRGGGGGGAPLRPPPGGRAPAPPP